MQEKNSAIDIRKKSFFKIFIYLRDRVHTDGWRDGEGERGTADCSLSKAQRGTGSQDLNIMT